jgi:hypothetical protein
VDVGLAVIGAIGEFLGQVRAAVERSGEVLTGLVGFIIQHVLNEARSLFSSAFEAVASAIDGFISDLNSTLNSAFESFSRTGSLSPSEIQAIDAIIGGTLFQVLLGVGIALLTLMTILTPYTLSLGVVLALLTPLLLLLVWQSLLGQDGRPPDEESRARSYAPTSEVGPEVLGDAFEVMMGVLLPSPQLSGASFASETSSPPQPTSCDVAVGLASFFIGRSGLFAFVTLAANVDKTRFVAAEIGVTLAVFSVIVGAFGVVGGILGLVGTIFAALLGLASIYYGVLSVSGIPSAGTLGTISAILGLIGIGIAIGGLIICS